MSASTPQQPTGTAPPFPIVGIGASAGGLKAAEMLLRHTPADSGMAFVLVFHLDPNYKSEAAELLQRHARVPVTQVTGRTPLEPNHAYVIPPGHGLELSDGAVELTQLTPEDGRPTVIDRFFRSLAQYAGENALGVVLSGTGTEGSLGLKAIKEAGGLAIVQEAQEAEFPGMPQSAIATGLIDFVLPAAQIAAKLAEVRNFALDLALPPGTQRSPEEDASALQKIFVQLRVQLGHDFSHYKQSTMVRRIARRMQMRATPDLTAYLQLLRTDTAEASALLRELLISVTSFFRDADAMEAFARLVVPALCKRTEGQTLRVWVPGCATGEEAYTLAMLLAEGCDGLAAPPRLQIFASDVDEHALEVARRGAYPDAIAADVSAPRLQRFFEREGDRLVVKPALRKAMLFTRHDILQDPPFSQLDLVSCRNLLIYLKSDIQARVFELFHFALKPRGYLFLGVSESLGNSSKLFTEVNHKAKLFQARQMPVADVRIPVLPVWPLRDAGRPPARERPRKRFEDIARDAMLRSFVPPCVIVNENNEVTYVHGSVGKYLEPGRGEANFNILDMARPGLRPELRSVLYKAFHSGAETRSAPVRLQGDGDWIELTVQPLPEAEGHVLVVFEDREAAAAAVLPLPAPDDNEQIAQMESELARTRETLQTTIEELETSNEELRAANEEMQSVNEELQSTTEELETGKEELQSTNEELLAVNSELQARNDDLLRVNSDLSNLIASTDIGTLFLDEESRVRRFTPRTTDIFNLIESDVGRPLAHVTHRLASQDLLADVAKVLDSLVSVEREFASTDGRSYQTRIRPYRTIDNKLGGVVLTFVDVTERVRAQAALRQNQEQEAYMLRLADDIRSILDARQRVISAMRLLALHLGVNRAVYCEIDATGEFATPLGDWATGLPDLHGRLRLDDFGLDVRRTYAAGKALVVPDSAELRIGNAERASYEKLGIRAAIGVPIIKDATLKAVLAVHHREPRAWSSDDLALIEETAERMWAAVERARAERALAQSEEKYRALFETMGEAFCIIESFEGAAGETDFRCLECNAAFVALTNLPEPVGKSLRATFPEDASAAIALYEKVLRTGEAVGFERMVPDLGRFMEGHAFRLGDSDSGRVAVLFQDVTERMHAEQRQKLLLSELNHRVKNNLAIVQTLAAQTFQSAACKAALATFEARLTALSTAHDVLTRESWNGADVGDVVRGTLAAWTSGADPRVRIEGEGLRLRPTAAQALTLALHELATNASKYGALSNALGQVEVRWRVTPGRHGRLQMTWHERGGPPVQPPARRGFGSWLIETGLAQDLGGKVELAFEPQGVTCRIEAPVAEIREPAP